MADGSPTRAGERQDNVFAGTPLDRAARQRGDPAFLAAALSGELKLQGWHGGQSMRRYLAGAAMMGFGGMLAGGCAVGAGITGGSVFALTAWITLCAMWLAAGITDRLIDYRAETMAEGGTAAA